MLFVFALVRVWCLCYACCSQRVVLSCNFNSAFYKNMIRLRKNNARQFSKGIPGRGGAIRIKAMQRVKIGSSQKRAGPPRLAFDGAKSIPICNSLSGRLDWTTHAINLTRRGSMTRLCSTAVLGRCVRQETVFVPADQSAVS